MGYLTYPYWWINIFKGEEMTLRQHILDIIGQEHAHLKGKVLLERYHNLAYNEGHKEGKSFKDNFFFGLHTEATIPLDAVCGTLLPLLGNFPEDQKFKFEYGLRKAGGGIIRHQPLGQPPKAYPEDNVVKECYFKLEGYYKQ